MVGSYAIRSRPERAIGLRNPAMSLENRLGGTLPVDPSQNTQTDDQRSA